MVDVSYKRCSYHSCKRHPSFNAEGSKTPIYCKQHAEVGMVNVRSKRCSHATCMKWPSFNVEGKLPAYCKEHADDGMVNVCTRRSGKDSRTTGPALRVPNNVDMTPCTRPNAKILDDSGINVRKRPRLAHSAMRTPHSFGHSPVRDGVVETAGMGPGNGVTHTSSSVGFRRAFNDDTVGTAAKDTRHMTSERLTPLPDEHRFREQIKTEIELVVFL